MLRSSIGGADVLGRVGEGADVLVLGRKRIRELECRGFLYGGRHYES